MKDPVRSHWMENDKIDKLEEEGGDDGGIRMERRGTLLNVIMLTGIGMMKCMKEK